MTVIWEREIDEAKIARRNQLFLRGFVFPSVAALVIGLVFGGPGAALGLLILLGLFGLLLGGWVWMTNHNESSNAEMTLEGTELKLGKRVVATDRVARFTTYESSITNTTADASSTIAVGKADFHVRGPQPDGTVRPDEIEFMWPEMGAEGLVGVRAALEQVLPGLWVPLEQYRQPLPQDGR